MELDQWQKQILETKGNIVLRSGRQIGKSTIISIYAANFAISQGRKQILIISATERQAYLLFSKVLAYILDTNKKSLKTGKDRPTKSEIRLKNGSIIRCVPTGLDGIGIRGFQTDLLIADEAGYIPEAVWPAVVPQLITTSGQMILLSTPHVKEGFFYRCFNDESFTKFHFTTQEVAEQRKEPQRTDMLQFLEREKKRMTQLEFAKEYLGEFLDELKRVYSEKLINECCVLKRRNEIQKTRTYFLGVDIARLGNDSSAFAVLDRTDRERLEQVELILTQKTLTTETEQKILDLESQYHFRSIYLDAGAGTLGVSVLDHLLENDSTKRKVEALNNRAISQNRDDTKRQRLLKEDLHMNLRYLMEAGKIKLLDDDELCLSLRSFTFEIDQEKKKLKIISNYNDPGEALVRAAWCVKDKRLNIWMPPVKYGR